MTQRFKLITEDEKVGVWIDEILLLKTIKTLETRNSKLYNVWVKKYENLTEKKYNKEIVNNL